ncbi:glycosyltransferase family 1 protein [Paraburkholderia bonniea]|uniref:glycosyltransferase family 4 protein n=1 Tax=Paraburkholderia bonniea TaxID=2152891 RepID=UPI0025732268|nr:glycosyltransferase family 1 protein [Paraburkholderia bonniea]WJF90808.1 glycosyltransferase family 1 protein [Paraburkholderia bonniea]WJF94122.1 glycosyltransferase family 1 protein [Paraburkholderia bonniea]
MKQIYIDISRPLARLYNGLMPTGIDRVALAYIHEYFSDALAVISYRGTQIILSEISSKSVFELLSHFSSKKTALRHILIRACINHFFKRSHAPGFLLHLNHGGMEFPGYYARLQRHGIKPVFMVHDLIPLTHAEYTRPGVDVTHRRRIHTCLAHAAGIIVNSQATAASLRAEAHAAQLALPPCTVAHLASGIAPLPLPEQAQPRPLAAPYFVMLGTIEARKNHLLILNVWRSLVEQLGAAAPRLVIIGRRGWECENVIDMLERCTSLHGVVIEEAHCPDNRLQAWLEHAQALLFPSFAEGYGMPLVEALALRVPVLASDLPVFHEIAGDIPEYLDPLDGPGWRARIQAYASADSPERAAQLTRIEAFQAPTWAAHFTRVNRFLDDLST